MVAEVIALDPMLAVAEVAERQLGADQGRRHGRAFASSPARRRPARCATSRPTASEGTRTYRVEVALDNSDRSIADGVTAEVEFQLAPVPAVRVPRSALTFSAAGELSVRIVGDRRRRRLACR